PSGLEKAERSKPAICRIRSGLPPAALMASRRPVVAAIEIIGFARTACEFLMLHSANRPHVSIKCRGMSRQDLFEVLLIYERDPQPMDFRIKLLQLQDRGN